MLAPFSQLFVLPVRATEFLPVLDDLLNPNLYGLTARIGGGEFNIVEKVSLTDGLHPSELAGKLWPIGTAPGSRIR
jgi:hypothetical protein